MPVILAHPLAADGRLPGRAGLAARRGQLLDALDDFLVDRIRRLGAIHGGIVERVTAVKPADS